MAGSTVILQTLKRFENAVLIVAGAAALTTILMSLEFSLLEANLYDFRMSHGAQSAPSSDIVLVTLDDATTESLNEFAPLPLDHHARLLEALERLEPKAVGYLVDMARVHEMNPDLFQTEWSRRFVRAAERMEGKGIPFLLGTPFGVNGGEVVPPYPLSALPHSLAVIHKDGNVFAEDKITRRALVSLYDKPVFHSELAERLGLVAPGARPRGAFFVPEVDGNYFFFRYHGTPALHPSRPHELPYRRVLFSEVLRGSVRRETLAGKIVLVGTLTKEDSGDFAYTPYSKTAFSNPKIVVHATILDSIIGDNGVVRAPKWLNWGITFSVTAFVLGWVMNSTPLYGVFSTLTLSVVFLIAGQLLFTARGLWIRESQPLVGIFLSYYLVVPYRLILEYKKRWEIQRQNDLLRQVEELKTNFLSLVTHDLKTPVARIHGLAEVLLRKAADRLVERDLETLHHILASTEELNRFISSILELTKIESNRIQLRLESKDLNQLVEKAVEGFRAQARAHGSHINVRLEPLFPIKVDASLITKVINNLIDNALKYSPPGGEITVESREVGEWVEISVRDQGIGMTAEERKKLFTRFYRAKNDTTTRVIGTGLGLYLTKYFIEAHQGRVEVESERGSGSVFKILLPIEALETAAASKRLAASDETHGEGSRPGLAWTGAWHRVVVRFGARGARGTALAEAEPGTVETQEKDHV